MRKIAEAHMRVIGEQFPAMLEVEWENTAKGEQHKLELPRYLPWSGSIEAFFLPPQEEFVELSDTPSYGAGLNGTLNGSPFHEKISWTKNLGSKYTAGKITREYGGDTSEAEFYGSWKAFPQITSRWNERHTKGTLETEITGTNIPAEETEGLVRELADAVLERAKHHGNERGTGELAIWKKEWDTKGSLPLWKKTLCPIEKPIVNGRLTEVGMTYKQGHGDWYKIYELKDGRTYLLIEEGFTWGTFEKEEKHTHGKRTYHLYLYEIKTFKEGIEIVQNKQSGLLEEKT